MNQTKSQNQIKMRIPNRHGETQYSDIPEWLQELRENLVDERVLERRDSHASSSHEPSLELMRCLDLGKHSVYTHFPKDRNCEMCQRTRITRAPCRRRNGGAVLRAEKFGGLITADHKVLSEECESRNNHRYAVVVQDLATQWIQSHPCKTKTSQETERSLQKFLEPTRKPKVNYTDKARTSGAKVHFASLMDICHLKNAELEAKHQKYKGRVVLRGDIVKDNSGSHSVFTEQGSSASQMTAAKVMDIISRLPGCDGQAADAVSAYTQVKMEDAHRLLKIPKSECPDTWIRLPRHKWSKSWSSMEDLVVLLERNLYGHPLAGLLWKRQFEKILLQHGWEKVPNWECLSVHREKGLFLSVYVDDIKLDGKKQNLDPMWKLLNKEVDLGEPTSFLDHVYLGCTQRQCQISKDIVDNYRTMFESRISAGRVEKLPFPQNLRISS